MSNKKPASKAEQEARIAAVKTGLDVLLKEQQVDMMVVPGEYSVTDNGTAIISPPRLAFRAV